MPVPKWDWREPSAAQPKDQFGNPNQTRWRLRSYLHGRPIWTAWFDDRDDADAFMWSMANHIIGDAPFPLEDIRHLPTEVWGEIEFWPDLSYEFVTQVFLTSGAGSGNQTYTVPSDWNSASNDVQTIGSGGSGGAFRSSGAPFGGGGAGGAWNDQTNITLTPSGSATYNVGAGGAGKASTGTGLAGSVGGDVWFNGTTLAGSSVGSKGGNGGTTAGAATTGASGAAGVGAASHNGGGAGSINTFGATGGGGAAGSSANGVTSTNASSGQTAGGRGDGTAGGIGGTASGGGTAGAGAAGTEWDATHGSGGGGGASFSSSSAVSTGGTPGNYGAGSGGCGIGGGSQTATTVAGAQGIVYINYTPSAVVGIVNTNLAMIGM